MTWTTFVRITYTIELEGPLLVATRHVRLLEIHYDHSVMHIIIVLKQVLIDPGTILICLSWLQVMTLSYIVPLDLQISWETLYWLIHREPNMGKTEPW